MKILKFTKHLLIFFILTITTYSSELILDLTYKNHTLPFSYPYEKGIREFRKDLIIENLISIANFKTRTISDGTSLGVIRNYSNIYGLPLPTENNTKDKFGIERDNYGNLRNQGIPLYSSPYDKFPKKYAKDGELVSLIPTTIEGWSEISFTHSSEVWYVPNKYTKILNNPDFSKIIVVDIKNQNIMTVESDSNSDNWLIRSMTNSTTGLKRPPFSFSTEPGIFVLQDKVPKMKFLKEGSKTEIEGYAPFATRFSGGGYIHGVPVNLPQTEIIESIPTLGTTPRSHKCVRTYSSHAEFIYNWTPSLNSLVIILN